MGADGCQHQHGCCWRNNRSASRQAVTGRACRCGDDHTICRKGIQILIIDINVIIDHSKAAASIQYDVIECQIFRHILSIYMNGSFQHHPIFHRVRALDQSIQCTIHILFLDLGQISQMSKINAQKRDISSCQIPGSSEKRSVSPQHQNTVHIFSHFRIVGFLFSVCISSTIADETVLSVFRQILRNL